MNCKKTLIIIYCLLISIFTYAQPCNIDLSTLAAGLNPLPGSVLCANEPLSLPNLNFIPGNNMPNPGIAWLVMTCQPSETNPFNDDCNTSILLSDNDGAIFNAGDAFFSETALLTNNLSSITVTIVPIILPNIPNFEFDKECFGVQLNYDYPTYTFLNPLLNPGACNSDCEGNIPTNNDCSGAINLNLPTQVGQTLNLGNYSTLCATSVNEPSVPNCFSDNYTQTVWFQFEGDGSTYTIQTVNCTGTTNAQLNNTQIAIYSGNCNNLTYLTCNENNLNNLAGITNFLTQNGVNYYIMVDGNNTNEGEFCIDITNTALPPCEAFVNIEQTLIIDHACEGDFSLAGFENSAITNTNNIFVTQYLLVHDGVIEQVLDAPLGLVPITNGAYSLQAFNYNTQLGNPISDLIVEGTTEFDTFLDNLNTAGIYCADVAPIVDFVAYLSTQPICCAANYGTVTPPQITNVCPGDATPQIILNGFNNSADFTTIYIITQQNNVVATATLSQELNLSTLPEGTYQVHVFNYATLNQPDIEAILANNNLQDLVNALNLGLLCAALDQTGVTYNVLSNNNPLCGSFECEAIIDFVYFPVDTTVCLGNFTDTTYVINDTMSFSPIDGYQNIFIITDALTNQIYYYTTQPIFDFNDGNGNQLPIGAYTVYVLNYALALENEIIEPLTANLTWQQYLQAIQESCFALYPENVTFNVISPNSPICAPCEAFTDVKFLLQPGLVCAGKYPLSDYTAAVSYNDSPGFATLFLFVQDNGTTYPVVSYYSPGDNIEINGLTNYLAVINAPDSVINTLKNNVTLGLTSVYEALDFLDQSSYCYDADVVAEFLIVNDVNVGTVTFPSNTTICQQIQPTITIDVQNASIGDYVTQFIIIGENGNIAAISSNPNINFDSLGLAIGNYTIAVINYNGLTQAAFDPVLTIGSNWEQSVAYIHDFLCAEITAPSALYSYTICEPPCDAFVDINQFLVIDFLCEGSFDFTGIESNATTNTNDGYLTQYLLVYNGVIQNVLDAPLAQIPVQAGNYALFAINYNTQNGNPISDLIIQGTTTYNNFIDLLSNSNYCTDIALIVDFSPLPSTSSFCCPATYGTIDIPALTNVCPGGLTPQLLLNGFNNSDDFNTIYIITQQNNIVATTTLNNGLDFGNFAQGTYQVHAFNYAKINETDIEDILANNNFNDLLNALNLQLFCAALDAVGVTYNVLAENNIECLSPLNVNVDTQNNDTTYTIFVQITGGTGVYLLNGNPINSTDSIGPIPCGQPTTLVITDDVASDTVIIQLPAPCTIFCGNSAGSLSDQLAIVCSSSNIEVTANNPILYQNNVLRYYLHTDPDIYLATILSTNQNGSFNANSSPNIEYNVEYYISAVVANLINGEIDLNDVCTKVSNPMPVVFLAPITFNIDEHCDWKTTGEFTVITDINGGLPAFTNGATYNITGDYSGTLGNNETFAIVFPESISNVYEFNVSDDNNCEATYVSQPFDCIKTAVELLQFDGEVLALGNRLFWSTITEINSNYFILERSTNGINFENIATIEALKNSTTLSNYQFIDNNAPIGVTYYRLTPVDVNGNLSSAPVIQLHRQAMPLQITNLNPTPAINLLQVTFTNTLAQSLKLKITDINGKLLLEQAITAESGVNTTFVNVSNLSSGMYFITLTNFENNVTQKFVKQ